MNNMTIRKILRAKELIFEAIEIFDGAYYVEEIEMQNILEQTMVKIKNIEAS